MPLNWIDPAAISFNALLLLERAQIAWFPRWNFPPEIATALAANPSVAWYLRHKCPAVAPWVDGLLKSARRMPPPTPEEIRRAEVAVLSRMVDLLTYALDPAAYDCQPFLAYADAELTDLVDLTGKTVIDVGAGTGRLAFAAAPLAKVVFAVEPVANLRDYMRAKALGRGLSNLYPVDGLITAIPFPAGFAHVTLGGHVFGDDPEEEYAELLRVTQPGGTIVLLPGNNDGDNQAHAFLSAQGFQWARFIEPPNDAVRKYWKVVE